LRTQRIQQLKLGIAETEQARTNPQP
jgi:hypothetical protein